MFDSININGLVLFSENIIEISFKEPPKRDRTGYYVKVHMIDNPGNRATALVLTLSFYTAGANSDAVQITHPNPVDSRRNITVNYPKWEVAGYIKKWLVFMNNKRNEL